MFYSQQGSVVSAEPIGESSPCKSRSSAQTWWLLPLQSVWLQRGPPRSNVLWGSPGPLGWSGAVSLKAKGVHVSEKGRTQIPLIVKKVLLLWQPNSRVKSPKFHPVSYFTSFQQPDSHWGDLNDVLVVTDVSSEYGGSLSGETAGVQLHDLLTSLQDLQRTPQVVQFNTSTHKSLQHNTQTLPLVLSEYVLL